MSFNTHNTAELPYFNVLMKDRDDELTDTSITPGFVTVNNQSLHLEVNFFRRGMVSAQIDFPRSRL